MHYFTWKLELVKNILWVIESRLQFLAIRVGEIGENLGQPEAFGTKYN